jgi:hypothetical protein
MKTDKPYLRKQKRPYMQRPIDRIDVRQRFLIVCEGEKTEPNYFKSFPIPPESVVVRHVNTNTRFLVEEAMRMRDAADQKYDQVWCVFDRDENPAAHFNAALQLADDNGIQYAYSNQAFELWYVLHFEYLCTAVSRKTYMTMLEDKKRLGHYAKNSLTIYDELGAKRQADAIRRADKLLKEYQPPNPYQDDPSTRVHLLVKELNKLFLYRR